MKYLVNRETKEHRRWEPMITGCGIWEVVEADSDGWIPWSVDDDVCPVGLNDAVWARFSRNGKTSEYEADRAGGLMWGDPSITHYKPILTEQSKPTVKQYLAADIFTRLRTATEHAASIPSIIAEIDALLGPEYQVVRVEQVEAQPVEDMSDWRNWREGDLLECVAHDMTWHEFGKVYRLGKDGEGDYGILDNDGDALNECAPHGIYFNTDYFRFHSRPTGASK